MFTIRKMDDNVNGMVMSMGEEEPLYTDGRSTNSYNLSEIQSFLRQNKTKT